MITSYAYDTYGRITQKVMPKGNADRILGPDGTPQGSIDVTYATAWTYYTAGATVSKPATCSTSSAVDQSQLPKTKTPHGIASTTFVYDLSGRAVAETNGRGTTCQTYDAEGRVTTERAPGDVQPTTYTYDPAGQVRTATDGSGTVVTEYDESGATVRAVDSFGAEARFAYDADGNIILRTAAAGPLATSTSYQTQYGYDEADRLTSIIDPAGRSYVFRYDGRGNLHAMQYPNGTFSWRDFDAAGRLTALYNRHGTLPAPDAESRRALLRAVAREKTTTVKEELAAGGRWRRL